MTADDDATASSRATCAEALNFQHRCDTQTALIGAALYDAMVVVSVAPCLFNSMQLPRLQPSSSRVLAHRLRRSLPPDIVKASRSNQLESVSFFRFPLTLSPPCLTTPSMSPTCPPFPAATAVPSQCHARTRPVRAAPCDSGGIRWLLPVAIALTMASAAFSVAHAQGTWSTAQLSVARHGLVATSVGNFAVFAGGLNGSALFCNFGGQRGRLLRLCRLCCALVWIALRPLAHLL
jgi:hypothetical protein